MILKSSSYVSEILKRTILNDSVCGELFLTVRKVRCWITRIISFAIAAYGVYAFVVRQIGEYMLLKTPFVFFDFSEPLIFFFLDYLAVMGIFASLTMFWTFLQLKKDSGSTKNGKLNRHS